MTLPTYNAIQFHSKEEHLSHLYDACLEDWAEWEQKASELEVTVDYYVQEFI
jgi:hypothetical protein